jgi:drug/metabolite transporter (DMT)-like permease
MSETKTNWLGLYLAVGIIWGGSFLFIALGNQFLPPIGVGFWRLALGGIPLMMFALIKRLAFPTRAASWFKIFVVSLCMNSIPSALFAFAERHVTSAFAGIMNAATPIATVLMILLVFREETPTTKVLFGLGVGLAGVLTVLAVWNGFGKNDPLAIAALVGAVSLYGIGGPFARRYVSPLKLDIRVQVPVQVLIGAATLAPFYFASAPFTAAPTWQAIAGMLTLGVLGTGFAYIWYYRLMAIAGSAIANSVTYLSPVVAVLAGALVLGEQVTWNQILGGVIVILGAAISQGRFDALFRK